MTPSTLSGATWLNDPALVRIFSAFARADVEVRAVGGAVRNTLLGLPVSDIDLATPATPDVVTKLAEAAGFSVHPTGIAHGTVTVVADGAPYEVTTLRRDVETDGRRAVVAFSRDWREDAQRRDFTINAIYADSKGNLFDPTGGLPDIAARRVRFIGKAEDRIREDYLRILRFFRFTAAFAEGTPDPQGLAACTALKSGMSKLSAERIGAEVMKLLDTPRAADIAATMSAAGIFEEIFGKRADPAKLSRLMEIERANGFAPDRLARLAALAASNASDVAMLAARLRLPNSDIAALDAMIAPDAAYDPNTTEKAARARLYACGADAYRRACLLSWATSQATPDDALRKERTTLPDRWQAPRFSVKGADVLALGVPPGPRVGAILSAFEAWWIEEDFTADTALQNAALRELVNRC